MSTAGKRKLTPQEYLAIERAAPFRSEFYDGEMFAVAGASKEHCRIKDNISRKVGDQLEGGPCEYYTSDLRLKISESGYYAYPAMVIVCGEPLFDDDVFDSLLNPRIIVEVLSDSTGKYDRGFKFEHYRRLPTLMEYVLVAQHSPRIERFARQPDQTWKVAEFTSLTDVFSFVAIDVQVPLHEIYRTVKFKEATP